METTVLNIFQGLDEAVVEAPPERIEINNLVDADRAFGVIARAQSAIEDLIEDSKAIRATVIERAERMAAKYQALIDAHTQAIEPFARDIIGRNQALDKNSAKSIPLFSGVGTAGYKKSMDKLVYSEENEEKVKEWCTSQGIPLRTKVEIDKKALNENWKKTGDIPDDATVIRGTDKFSVTVNKKNLQTFFDEVQAKKALGS